MLDKNVHGAGVVTIDFSSPKLSDIAKRYGYNYYEKWYEKE